MRTFVLPLLIFSVCIQLKGQIQPDTSKSHLSFRLLRAEEDYSCLKNNLADGHPRKSLQCIHLFEKIAFGIGGDVRAQFQVLRNEDWQNGNDDGVLYQRLMLHSDWHLGRNIRLFGQLKSGFAFGRNGSPSPLDEDRLDVHQLFAGLRLGASTIEIGRQELRYGSRRLIDVREGANVRQSFDGTRWIWQMPGKRLDVLFYTYNPTRTGILDNRINTDQLLWGGYFVWNMANPNELNFDFYYLGVRNKSPDFEEGSRRETRHSFGIRHWGSKGNFRYNNEMLVQTGTFGEGNIRAWTVSAELYYSLPGNIKPTLGLKTEIISGDRRKGDGNLNTFNPLYPRGGYFGLLALIGPANLYDIHPSVEFSFGKKWSLNLDWDFFWRHREDDGIYFPSGRLHVPGNGVRERFIGHQPGAQLAFSANRSFELEASFFHFQPGGFLQEVSEGKSFSQAGLSASFKF